MMVGLNQRLVASCSRASGIVHVNPAAWAILQPHSHRTFASATHPLRKHASVFRKRCLYIPNATTQFPEASEAEIEANKRRWEESGNGQGSVDEWRWTLNWDEITSQILIGSCPRSPEDLDVIAEKSGATAILCLQSDVCMEAMKINWGAIRDHGVKRNVLLVRVATRDFDHFDQAFMLPEAVKMLAALIAMDKRVYVHCTAGINRASLTVVGYLTFMLGKSLDEALQIVRSKRAQANPYVDCWKTARARLLEGCEEQVAAKAKQLWAQRKDEGREGDKKDGLADWVAAEDYVVSQLLKRQLGCTLSLVSSIKDLQDGSMAGLSTLPMEGLPAGREDFKRISKHLVNERVRLREALAQLADARREIDDLRHGVCGVQYDEGTELLEEIEDMKAAMASMKILMKQIWSRSSKAVAGQVEGSMDEISLEAATEADPIPAHHN